MRNGRKAVNADASSAVHLSASSQPNKRKMVVQAARDDASVNDIEKIFGSLPRDEKKKKKKKKKRQQLQKKKAHEITE